MGLRWGGGAFEPPKPLKMLKVGIWGRKNGLLGWDLNTGSAYPTRWTCTSNVLDRLKTIHRTEFPMGVPIREANQSAIRVF